MSERGAHWNLRLETTDTGRLPERVARRLVTPRIEDGGLVYRGIAAQVPPEEIVTELRARGLNGAYQVPGGGAGAWIRF